MTPPANRQAAKRIPPRAEDASAALFRQAVRVHLGGDAGAAELAYRKVLQADDRHVQALNNLATILAATGRRADAAHLLARAIEIEPRYGEAFNNLGLVLGQLGDHGAARACFLRAVACEGVKPDWFNNLGTTCVELQQFEEAVMAFDAAIEKLPGNAAYWSNRGIALRGLGRADDAVQSFEHAIDIDPRQANALSNLGILYKEQRRYDDATRVFERALAIDPDAAAVYANFASVFEARCDHERMRELAQRSVELDPNLAEGYNQLGNYELEAGRIDEAERLYWRAIALSPQNANANWNLAIIWLLRGEYGMGWHQFEWRKRLHPELAIPAGVTAHHWDGTNLEGRTILLTSEQGLGDTLQFIRYVPLVRRAGAGKVIVECQPPLQELIATVEGVDEVVPRGTPFPPHDIYASLMSLPHLLGTTLETVPATVPYLRAAPRAVGQLVAAHGTGLKVGIVWAGNPLHPRDALRSVPLRTMARLFDVPGATFFSLQKGEAPRKELRELGDQRIFDLAPHLKDFRDTTAAIDQLDLVISVDTSVAHLAGALGKPVWILLPSVPDYRWLLGRSDSPWYPNATLFRQSMARQWGDTIDRAVAELCRITGTEATEPRAGTFIEEAESPPTAALVAERTGIAIDWELRSDTGWGVYGTHLALALSRRPDVRPIILAAEEESLHPITAFELARPLGDVMQNRRLVESGTGVALLLHGLGNNFQGSSLRQNGRDTKRAGVIFFEDTAFDATALTAARSFDLIVTGSTWNTMVLRDAGLTNVVMALQGVDTTVFHPAPGSDRFSDRFVIFSGGKLEYRKGQDIVAAAFRAFRQRHPEALLITAWHNAWTSLATDFDLAGHVRGTPAVERGSLRVREWLAGNGIPSNAVLDIGRQPNALMAGIVREADVALFTNRCEGGTNLVAMECMAAGVPTIVSANTGHLDLVAAGATALTRQEPCAKPRSFFRATDGWGESDVEEAVEALEAVWRDRQAANARAAEVAVTMQDWAWPKQVDRLLTALAPLLPT